MLRGFWLETALVLTAIGEIQITVAEIVDSHCLKID